MPGTKSIDQRVDDWWDKHYGDVYLDDGTAPQDQEVMLEEEPPPVFITFGEGSDTLQQLAPQFDDPEVTRRSHNAYQGALRAWANYGDSFSQFGDEYDVDPYILARGRIMPGRSLEDRLDPRLSIEAAAKLFNQDRDILKNEDLAVLAYNVGHNGVKAIIQGEKDFPGKSQYYWPVITLTHERLTQELRE